MVSEYLSEMYPAMYSLLKGIEIKQQISAIVQKRKQHEPRKNNNDLTDNSRDWSKIIEQIDQNDKLYATRILFMTFITLYNSNAVAIVKLQMHLIMILSREQFCISKQCMKTLYVMQYY